MPLNISNITINNPALAQITFEVGRSYGRRFEVKNLANNESAVVTMNELYKSAYNAYKANTEDKAALQALKDYLETVSKADKDANVHYADAGCFYHFRTFFHRLGDLFSRAHSKKLSDLTKKIDTKLSGTSAPTVQVVTGKWDESSKLTNKAFEPLPAPKKFEGNLISKAEFTNLLHKHQAILNEDGSGTHGYTSPNLNLAFDHGQGSTTLGGNAPFFKDNTLNQEFHLKFKQVMTLISQEKDQAQADWMRPLTTAFRGCNPGRVYTVQQISDNLLNNSASPDFATRVQIKINGHKNALFDQLIREMAPKQDEYNTPIHHQIPHLTTGYLAQVGETLGLNGHAEANEDQHKYTLNTYDGKLLSKAAFIQEFKKRLAAKIDEIANDLAMEINDPNGPFHPTGEQSFGSWAATQVNNGSLNQEFGFYDDSKKYPGIKEPSEDQKDNMYYYLSNVEVRHILGMLGYLQ